MFEEITVESIRKDILERIDLELSKETGSFLYQIVSGISWRIWNTYQSMNALLPIAYVNETSGEYLDKRCEEVGIVRKPGTKASLKLNFVGTPGLTIPAGTVFLTTDELGFTLDDSVVISEEGTGGGWATALEIGEVYNIAAGKITKMYVHLSGLTTYTNEAASGGENRESDVDLYGRLVDYWTKPATSGNVHEYHAWALSVDGVGAAKVIPVWDGAGTVKVIIADPSKKSVDTATVSRCAAYIESVRPIGADVTVVSATEKAIHVTATVTIAKEVTLEDVKSAFIDKLNDYITDMAFQEGTFLYHRVGYLLLGCEGVEDFSALTLNEGTENIVLSAEEIPVLGQVVINLASDD